MPTFRARLAILVGTAAPLPLLLGHCGGGAPDRGGGGVGNDAGQDASSNSTILPDGSPDEVDIDANASRGDDSASGEASSVGDTSGGGQDAGPSGDGAVTIHETTCQVGAGDGGDNGPSCPGMQTCCGASASPTGGYCADTSKDPRHCGSCGTSCSPTQFCTGVACVDVVLKNICANPNATWLTDSYGPDNTAGNAMGNGFATCMPPVTILTVNDNGGVATDPVSGRPLAGGGNTLVAGGGWFGHASVLYMDNHKLTPLIVANDGTNAWIRNQKTSANIVFTSLASLTPHHDFFLLELSVEPVSGTLCFFGYGMLSTGTIAAGYYFQNTVMPNLSTYPGVWYVYEWTDANNDGLPNAGDTFALVGNGT